MGLACNYNQMDPKIKHTDYCKGGKNTRISVRFELGTKDYIKPHFKRIVKVDLKHVTLLQIRIVFSSS